MKEARILRDLQHPNIVNFKGICTTPVALILEYAYFDFTPFGMNAKVSSLSGFLATLNDYDCAGFDDPRIFLGICKDIATGLQYLHHKNVAFVGFKAGKCFSQQPTLLPAVKGRNRKSVDRVPHGM